MSCPPMCVSMSRSISRYFLRASGGSSTYTGTTIGSLIGNQSFGLRASVTSRIRLVISPKACGKAMREMRVLCAFTASLARL